MKNHTDTARNDSPRHGQQRPRAPRGFALLIVLGVIAMASAIVAVQLSSVRGQEASQIRRREELKARDIAEHCLEVADAYAKAFGSANSDFDQLLDPDSVIEAADDDFLPPASLLTGTSSVAVLPPSGIGSKYRYRAFRVNVSAVNGTSGTCYIRYDDNSDDTSTALSVSTTSNHTVIEGADVDVPERDRDRSVIVTAIGVVPQRSDAQLTYAQAHARVTLRRVRAMPAPAVFGSAIHAGGVVDFDGDICGSVAGVIAEQVRGGLCVCGVLDAQLVSGSQGDCACGGETCAATTGSEVRASPPAPARADPTVVIPQYTTLLKNEAFGKVDSANNNIAAASYPAAVVYVRHASMAPLLYQVAGSSDVFVWDRFETDTLGTLGSGGASQNCTDTSALAALPEPCKWDIASNTVTCASGESPCWKLVGRINGLPAVDVDVLGPAVTGHTSATAFTPRGGDLPNVRTPAVNTRRWQDFAPGSCTTCDGSLAVVTQAGANYTVGANALANTPHMQLMIETSDAATTTVGALTRTGAKVSVHTTSVVNAAGSQQCCATCTCDQDCSASTTMTKDDNGHSYAIRTDETCADSGRLGVIGHVMCGQLDMSNTNGNCFVGGLIGVDAPGNIACTLPGTSSDIGAICDASAGFCAKNNLDIVGDLRTAGNICLKNNLDMHGGVIETTASVGWKNNPAAAVQIRAVGNVFGKNNATVTFNGETGGADNQGVGSSMWMDASW
jgi:hypothetical protein